MRRLWIICGIIWLGLWLGLALRTTAQPNVTSYPRMTAQLQADAARCSLLRLTTAGRSAKGLRQLWLIRAADPAADPAQTIRVLVLCRQHGDEPASTEAVLTLIHRLAGGGDPFLRASLAHMTFYFVPMVNPDGAEAGTRANGVGADLNRDWGVFRQPETRAVARAASFLHPNLVIDAHNWDGDDEYNADCLEIPRETVTAEGKASHELQEQALQYLSLSGYAVHPTAWGADTDPRLAHRWFARQNILSALVETHSGSPADHRDFERRQGMYAALLHGLARHYAAAHASEKKRLEAWEGDGSTQVQEAVLFPPVSAPISPAALSARHRHSYGWLWAFVAYGLALWGAGMIRTRPATSRFPSRNGRGRRADCRGAACRVLLSDCALLWSPSLSSLPGRAPSEVTFDAAGRWLLSGYYYGTRKRDGTETKARSGQRNAVSIPPR